MSRYFQTPVRDEMGIRFGADRLLPAVAADTARFWEPFIERGFSPDSGAGLEDGLVGAMEYEAVGLELSSRTADFKEGLVAFRERRGPNFEGR